MFLVRPATLEDLSAIGEIVRSAYGAGSSNSWYYDELLLRRLLESPHSLLLAAVDSTSGGVVGIASVDLETSPSGVTVGELGRLIVLPAFRARGIGTQLMRERLRLMQDRLDIGTVTVWADSYSLRIAETHGFAMVAFFPFLLDRRESLIMLVRHFGRAIARRKPRPRLIPEIVPVANLACENCSLPLDAISDEDASAYASDADVATAEFTSSEHASRPEFGPENRSPEILATTHIHRGVSNLPSSHARYVTACTGNVVVGVIGFVVESASRTVRIVTLASTDDRTIGFLLRQVEERCATAWGTGHIRVDVSAHAPRMQRTLIERGFVPVGYVPAFAEEQSARIDVVRMARVLNPPCELVYPMTPGAKTFAELVMHQFGAAAVKPATTSV